MPVPACWIALKPHLDARGERTFGVRHKVRAVRGAGGGSVLGVTGERASTISNGFFVGPFGLEEHDLVLQMDKT